VAAGLTFPVHALWHLVEDRACGFGLLQACSVSSMIK